MRERFCRPISSTSSNPSVIRRPMRAPFSSRIALVAMVVPCTKRSMSPGFSPLSASTASTPARTPATRSFGDEGTFAAHTWSPRRPITSVNVPPMSTPIRSPSWDSVTGISKSRPPRVPLARSVRLGERAPDIEPDSESGLGFGHKRLQSPVLRSPLVRSARLGERAPMSAAIPNPSCASITRISDYACCAARLRTRRDLDGAGNATRANRGIMSRAYRIRPLSDVADLFGSSSPRMNPSRSEKQTTGIMKILAISQGG